jgi:hypothetical protein
LNVAAIGRSKRLVPGFCDGKPYSLHGGDGLPRARMAGRAWGSGQIVDLPDYAAKKNKDLF